MVFVSLRSQDPPLDFWLRGPTRGRVAMAKGKKKKLDKDWAAPIPAHPGPSGIQQWEILHRSYGSPLIP